MCLGLDVGRSEACVADPTRLVIKDIIPTFMSADSFLDSSIFSLNRDANAHGGFAVDNKGKLAMGLGRENINAVLPLFLFKEHWEIARRKAPPIYGFICTLDIMGYASAQYFSIPFLVLLKTLQKASEGQEVFVKISQLVLETCKTIMGFNEEFRNNTIKMIKDFHDLPEMRTADVVASISVMLSQLYVLLQLDNYQQYLGDFKLDQPALQKIFRFAFEEQSRRAFKSDQDVPSKNQILKILFPDYQNKISAIAQAREREIIEEMKKNPGADNDEMAKYRSQALYLKSLALQQEEQKVQITTGGNEEAKSSVPAKKNISGGVDIQAAIETILDEKPWLGAIQDPNSDLGKLIAGGS
jgi:hypothetical protein